MPQHFVAALEDLPLTPNGKIRSQGGTVDRLRPVACRGDVRRGPDNEIEQKIATLWQELLGRSQVGVDDNFFDLGGHSLLVVRMHRQLTQVVTQPVAL